MQWYMPSCKVILDIYIYINIHYNLLLQSHMHIFGYKSGYITDPSWVVLYFCWLWGLSPFWNNVHLDVVLVSIIMGSLTTVPVAPNIYHSRNADLQHYHTWVNKNWKLCQMAMNKKENLTINRWKGLSYQTKPSPCWTKSYSIYIGRV